EGVIVTIKFSIIDSPYNYNHNLVTYMKSDAQKYLDGIKHSKVENFHDTDHPLSLCGYILTLEERIDEECTKTVPNTDPHSEEDVEHLKHEAQTYIFHTYYKFYCKAIGGISQWPPSPDISKSEKD
ncbi:Eukaryotic translation initiation factor 3 subunit C, partial [Galemys pyrenaicus]